MSVKRFTPSSHNISGVFVFLLLGVFAVFSTVMVLLSARAYKSTVDRLAEHNATRIAPAYVRSMVRADDELGGVSVEEIGGVTSVSLYNEYDGDGYITRIYCLDGGLYEWFSDAEREFFPEDGDKVCDCDGMKAEIKDGLLCVGLLSGETWTQVDIALRGVQ